MWNRTELIPTPGHNGHYGTLVLCREKDACLI